MDRVERGPAPHLFATDIDEAAIAASHPEWRACAKPCKADVLIAMLLERVRERRIG